ncbi:MAG: hypothetical protein JWM34_2855 [Ilumatobacteraceae bacterium]|nr:hypothetical protein [Ilumatobacteraceae bacterium]
MSDPRLHPRASRSADVRVTIAPERPLPDATTIDLSLSGLLLAFHEPVALDPGETAIVTIALDDGRLHTMVTARRIARGDDFRTYVAFSFDSLGGEELHRLQTFLAGVD